MASSAGTEKSGVPMNTILSGIEAFRRRLVERLSLGFARDFLELAHDDIALQAGEEIDDQLAVQVVDLMLKGGGQEAIGRQLLRFPLAVEIAHGDGRRPFDIDAEV